MEVSFKPGWRDMVEKHLVSGCNRCGTCCGDVPIVDVFPEDINRLARHFHMNISNIMMKYLTIHPLGGRRMTIKRVKPCVFFRGKCTIYLSRPIICRMYPWLAGKHHYCDTMEDIKITGSDEEILGLLVEEIGLSRNEVLRYLKYIGAISV
jgi:Fe-S-cluster containining protein